MTILRDAYRNGKHVALSKMANGKFEITIDGIKYKHQYRNYQNAVQEFLTIVYGYWEV